MTPEQRVYDLLVSIYEIFGEKGSIGLTHICRQHHLSSQYATFLIADGKLVNIRGSSRGPAIRRWMGDPPTEQYAAELTARLDGARLNANGRAIKKSIISEAKQVDKEIGNDQLRLDFNTD